MTKVEILKAARELIKEPDAWIKGRDWAFRFPDGSYSFSMSFDRANCWCAHGAIQRVCANNRLAGKSPFTLAEELILFKFNDELNHSHADILRYFDEWIGEIEATESGGTDSIPS